MKSITNHFRSHFDENFFINEVGINLAPDQHSKIRKKLESLELRAPSMSSIDLSFENKGKIIKGTIIINSIGKTFTATLDGDNPLEIYSLLEKKIDKQLLAWKKTRFRGGYIDTMTNELREELRGNYAV